MYDINEKNQSVKRIPNVRKQNSLLKYTAICSQKGQKQLK